MKEELPLLVAKHITKRFTETDPPLFKHLNFTLYPKETVAIMGKSGEGKSSFLHIIATLDQPQEGTLTLFGHEITPSYQVEALRNQKIGFIFQAYYLLEDFSVLENALMPLFIKTKRYVGSLERSYGLSLLKEVGLEHKQHLLAKHLSGGEKQRLAIARALCQKPQILFADEPTGNLDYTFSKNIQDLILSKVVEHDLALVLVTHDIEFALRCDRICTLCGGKLVEIDKIALKREHSPYALK